MVFLRHLLDGLTRYADFGGVSTRAQYWSFFAFSAGLSGLLSLLFYLTENDFFSFTDTFLGFALLLPGVAVTVRRLHDVGRSGWWALLALTVVGIPLLVYWLLQPSLTNQNNP